MPLIAAEQGVGGALMPLIVEMRQGGGGLLCREVGGGLY